MAKQFNAGRLTFEVDGQSITYRPSRSYTLSFKIFAVISIAIAATVFLLIVALSTEEPVESVRLSLVTPSGCFVLVYGAAVLFGWRKLEAKYVILSDPPRIVDGRGHIRSLEFASSIFVIRRPGRRSTEGTEPDAWFIAIEIDGRRHRMPMLQFAERSIAERVANEFADRLRLPVSS